MDGFDPMFSIDPYTGDIKFRETPDVEPTGHGILPDVLANWKDFIHEHMDAFVNPVLIVWYLGIADRHNALTAQVSNLSDENSALQTEKTTLSSQVFGLQVQIGELQGQIASFQADKAALTENNTSLEETIAQLRAELATCQAGNS